MGARPAARSVLSVTEREALTFRCYWCLARPGAWCLTEAGRVAVSLHMERIRLVSPGTTTGGDE